MELSLLIIITSMFVIIMGVAGAGKTTVGTALAAELGWTWRDADGFHPPKNIAKMAAGRCNEKQGYFIVTHTHA